jgi:transcriptional regulator with XRE-family HTH domain
MEFGEWLKEQREERGMSRAQLAREAGVSEAAISKWESGKQEPRYRELIKIAEVFDTSVLGNVDIVVNKTSKVVEGFISAVNRLPLSDEEKMNTIFSVMRTLSNKSGA